MKRTLLLFIVLLEILSTTAYANIEQPNSWAVDSVESLKDFHLFKEEVFQGYKENITRQEFIYFAVKIYEVLSGKEITPDPSKLFKDTSDIYTIKAATIGISSGIGNGNFGPNELLTREQLAVLLVNTMKLAGVKLKAPNNYIFYDEDKFSTWAKEAIYIAKVNDIISGVGDHRFNSNGYATKEDAIIMTNRILEKEGIEKKTEIARLLEDKKVSLSDVLKKYNYSNQAILEVNKVSETYDFDNDGLLDYYEIYRNFTDPSNPDTDGDGVLDGEWEERVEFTYTIKAQVRLIKPYDLEFMDNHIHQDINVIEETDEYADILIYMYPFNKLSETIVANDNWREDNQKIMREISPGKSNDWDQDMKNDLIKLLKNNGIDPNVLSDKELVYQVINFFEMDDYNGFEGYMHEISDITNTPLPMYDWFTIIDDNGNALLNEKLFNRDYRVKTEILETFKTAKQEFEAFTGEVWANNDFIKLVSSTKEMFYKQFHGSCSGTSEFYASIFQALGIPTKVMPIATTIDTGKLHDEICGDHKSLYDLRIKQGDNFKNELVRDYWLNGLADFGSSHIMNYIYIGNRWINMDVAGGMAFNRQVLNGDFIMFHKTADYDFADRLCTISEQWLVGDHNQFKRLNTSNNFSQSEANSVNNYYSNFSLKVFDIHDIYGKYLSKENKKYIAEWQEDNFVYHIYN